MTATVCKDCWAYRPFVITTKMGSRVSLQLCGVPPKHRPPVADQRAPDGECGPEAKLFAPRQEVA